MTSELQAIEAVSVFATSRHEKRLSGDELLEALSNGKPTQAAYNTLWLAAETWVRGTGNNSIQICAHLPTTGPALMRARRNWWLRHAASLLPLDTSEPAAHVLHREWETFLSRGPWLAWKTYRAPPPDASELRKALFFASISNDGNAVCLRTVQRALA